jgi:hypothetical protein
MRTCVGDFQVITETRLVDFFEDLRQLYILIQFVNVCASE